MSNSIQIHYANMAFMVPFLRNYLRNNQFSETQVGIQNLLEFLRNLRIQDPPQNIHDRDFQFFERVIREYKELHSPNIILQKRRHWIELFVIVDFFVGLGNIIILVLDTESVWKEFLLNSGNMGGFFWIFMQLFLHRWN